MIQDLIVYEIVFFIINSIKECTLKARQHDACCIFLFSEEPVRKQRLSLSAKFFSPIMHSN